MKISAHNKNRDVGVLKSAIKSLFKLKLPISAIKCVL